MSTAPTATDGVVDMVDYRQRNKGNYDGRYDGRIQLPAVIPKIKLIPFNQIRLEAGIDEWLVKRLIPRTGIGLAWGPSQTYKSFWLFDVALHVALGWDYRDRRVLKGAVIYCAFEGGLGLAKRVEAFRKHHDIAPEASVPFYLQALRFALIEHAEELIEAITTMEVRPVMIVLDTLNRSMTGSESKDADMGAYLAAADALREAFECFVMIVHHSGWDSSHARGHTSLPYGVDVEIAVTRPADLTTNAEIRKMKDGETGDVISSRLKKIDIGLDEDGDPITSLVVMEGDTSAPPAERREKLTKNQQTVFAILIAAGMGGMSVSDWNEKAREAGIGVKRKADLVDIRMALKAKKLIYEYNDRWFVSNPQTGDQP
jgi:AAA domain